MTNRTLLQIDELSAGYYQRGGPSRVVVHAFSATLAPGKLVCLIGPNGAGKSTLLRTIAGMQSPIGGSVELDGQDIHHMNAAERARRLSVVLTQKMEVGLFTAYALVALGRHPYTAWTGRLSDNDHRVVRDALRMVGAENLASRTFNTLSDGERQKVMIARALAQEPDVLVLDEPTAFLDLPRRVEVMVLLRELAHRTGRTILLSTHDLDLALRCADQMWLIDYGGRLSVGVPEDLVLNGTFEAAFRSANVTFDIETGAFKAHQGGTLPVVLEGDGVGSIWTRRALEREGYTVVIDREPGLPVVRVENTDEQTWSLVMGGKTVVCDSIDALLIALQESLVAV